MQIFPFKGNTLFDIVSFKNALWGRRATSDVRTGDVETGGIRTSNSKISQKISLRVLDTSYARDLTTFNVFNYQIYFN